MTIVERRPDVAEFLANVEYLRLEGANEAEAIRLAVSDLAHENLTIDAWNLARLVRELRVLLGEHTQDWNRTKDYVQHILRQTPHVCRHQVAHGSHQYRVHPEPECSPQCKEAWVVKRIVVVRRCAECNAQLPVKGECGICS